MTKQMLMGILVYLLEEGVDIVKFDDVNNIIYISIPKDSESYHTENSVIHDAESFVKRIKETWIELGILKSGGKLKYITRDVYWTKELGIKNREEKWNMTYAMIQGRY